MVTLAAGSTGIYNREIGSRYFFYSGTWPSHLMVFLSLGLVEVVGARNNVRSSFSQEELRMTRT